MRSASRKKNQKKGKPSHSAEVLVVGGGSFGTALATVLARNEHRVKVWVRFKKQADEINRYHTNREYFPEHKLPPTLEATTDLASGIRGTPLLILAIPSHSFREVVRKIAGEISGDQIVLHATKGIEPVTFKRMSEILREESCALKIGVISGPTLAMEVMKGHPSGAVIASHYDEVIRKGQSLFMESTLRLYGSRDVIGTEVGGAFKNIVALMAGAAHGIGFGDNTKSLIITRGLFEMIRYGVAMGGNGFSFAGLAGVGDLVATCHSPLSRNFQVGKRLAEGESLKQILATTTQVAEGVPTSRAVYEQALRLELDLPIVNAVHAALFEGVKVQDLMIQLMARPTGMEMFRA